MLPGGPIPTLPNKEPIKCKHRLFGSILDIVHLRCLPKPTEYPSITKAKPTALKQASAPTPHFQIWQVLKSPTVFFNLAVGHSMKNITKITTMKGKTLSKTTAKPAKRKLIPSRDRVDNNLAMADKNMGQKRTKGQKRDIKSIRSRVASRLAKFDLAHLDPHFTNVHNHLQYLNNQPYIKRALYPDEFKTSLMWMCSEPGISILKRAAEPAGLFDDLEAEFGQGVGVMIDLYEDLGSDTTEDTALWSISTDDTADLEDFIQGVTA
jgi:hypothetical protein